jgi:lysophospholipase L1-like esterase
VVVVAALVIRQITKPPEKVAVIGDSITVLSAVAIQKQLGDHPNIQAELGKRIDEMLPALRDALQKKPDAVVVNLGTNDVLQGTIHPDWRPGFLQLVQALEHTDCAVLVNINTTATNRSARPEFAPQINAAIAKAAETHDNFHVIDWDAIVHAPGGDALIQPDTIHPTGPGAQRLAREIRHTLADC